MAQDRVMTITAAPSTPQDCCLDVTVRSELWTSSQGGVTTPHNGGGGGGSSDAAEA